MQRKWPIVAIAIIAIGVFAISCSTSLGPEITAPYSIEKIRSATFLVTYHGQAVPEAMRTAEIRIVDIHGQPAANADEQMASIASYLNGDTEALARKGVSWSPAYEKLFGIRVNGTDSAQSHSVGTSKTRHIGIYVPSKEQADFLAFHLNRAS
ncbi:MAG: hypothetical protein V1685_04585 [Parcubacteria group bacterium]